MASTKLWEIHPSDITSAFLQGNVISRNVYVSPPKEFSEQGKLWQLKRCLYGLVGAPREWYNRVREVLVELGAKVSLYDHSMFIWLNDRGQLIGLLVSHVDDFVYCGILHWHDKVIGQLIKTFQISKQERGSFRYLGLNLEQTGHEIFVDQDKYIQGLKGIDVDSNRAKMHDEKLTDEEKRELRQDKPDQMQLTVVVVLVILEIMPQFVR